MGFKVNKQNKIIHFFLIDVIKMYNDNFFKKNHLGLWISYTLTNKKSNYNINKHMIRFKKKTKIQHNINLIQNYLAKKTKKKQKQTNKQTYLMGQKVL
jgi:hypothetical protein